MRCLTLADTLASRGWYCAFASAPGTTDIVPTLKGTQHDTRERAGFDAADVLMETWPEGCDVLVVDHYQLDNHFETACRSWAKRIMVIDDLADRKHDCDFLLDQTLGRSGDDYGDLVPASCRILTGSAYALLRPHFAAAREAALARRQVEKSVRRVLISCGATDPHNVTATVLEGLTLVAPDARVDVVLGGAAPQVSTSLANIYIDHEDMAGLMARADLAIGAAGTSSWERCCLGLPTLLVVTADNQRTVAHNLAESGAAIVIGDYHDLTPEHVAQAYREIIDDAEGLDQMRTAAARQCNGLGARLLAMLLEPRLSSDGEVVTLRPVSSADAEMILAWQRHPETRRFSHTTAVPTVGEHTAWMAKRLKDPDCIFLIIMHADEPVGVLRFDRVKNANGTGQGYRVSIFIDPGYYNLGIGTAALLLAEDLMCHSCLIAEVMPDNRASHALFNRAGFEKHDGYYTWELPR